MTLDEAIERYTSNAEYERTHGNLQGCLEFRQLAEWLKDYKRLLEQKPTITSTVIKQMRDATPEEQEAIAKYIKSISKPTGIEFDIDIDKKVESYGKLLKHPVVKHIMDEEQEQLDFVQPHKRIPVTLTVGGDCISRQQAKAYLYDRINRLEDNELYDIFSVIIDDMVNELPSIKPQTGHWIKTIGENGITSAVRCSECGFEDNRYMLFRYCPDCGAKMEVEQNG